MWNEDDSTATFNKIKETLISVPILVFSHFGRSFIVYTEASNVGNDATTLTQSINWNGGSETIQTYLLYRSHFIVVDVTTLCANSPASLTSEEYDFEICYQPDNKHANVDALSRPPFAQSDTKTLLRWCIQEVLLRYRETMLNAKNSWHFRVRRVATGREV